MRLTSPSRRAAGLLAVTTIGLSTAVLSIPGVASADMNRDYTFTTASSGADLTDLDVLRVSDLFCMITWDVNGGSGGKDSAGVDGEVGGHLGITVDVTVPQNETKDFYLYPGKAGGEAVAGTGMADDGFVGEAGENTVGNDGTPGLESLGSDDIWLYGGGGGAASAVWDTPLPSAAPAPGTAAGSLDGPYLLAHGGDGGGDNGGAGYGKGNNENNSGFAAVQDGAASWRGNGVISGTVHLCATDDDSDDSSDDGGQSTPTPMATGAPQVNWVTNTPKGVSFQLLSTSVASDDPITGVEYRLGDGAWTPVPTVSLVAHQYSGTIPGLDTGKRYSVVFRFTTVKGHSEASAAHSNTVIVPGPRDVTALAGASSIKVSWTAPADMTGVAGYVVHAAPDGDQSSAGEVSCRPVDALGTACVLPATPGLYYVVTVDTLDAAGARIATSWTISGLVPSPVVATTLPKADGTLTSDAKDGKAVAGEKITITGKDFLPGSTVQLVAYSTPVSLGSVVVLADGTFTAEVTLPKDMANGTHHLVATGVDQNGNPRTLVVEVTVSGGTAVLAFTGFSALPFIGGGVLTLAAGAGLLVASRRRAA